MSCMLHTKATGLIEAKRKKPGGPSRAKNRERAECEKQRRQSRERAGSKKPSEQAAGMLLLEMEATGRSNIGMKRHSNHSMVGSFRHVGRFVGSNWGLI